VSFAAGGLRLYLDGQLQASSTVPARPDAERKPGDCRHLGPQCRLSRLRELLRRDHFELRDPAASGVGTADAQAVTLFFAAEFGEESKSTMTHRPAMDDVAEDRIVRVVKRGKAAVPAPGNRQPVDPPSARLS
jgi:hypothetical protein